MRILLIILMIFVVIAAYILGGWMTIWLSKVTKFDDTNNDRDSQNIGCLFFWPVVMIILIPYSLYYFIKSSFIFFYNILFDTPKEMREEEKGREED